MGAKPESLKVVKDFARKEIVLAIAAVPGTRRHLFGGSDFQVYDLDLGAEKPEARALSGHESYVTGLAVAGRWAVSGGYDGRLIWWDLETRQTIRTVPAHAKWIRRVVATRDGKTVASVADDMVCRLWDAETGSLLQELRGHEPMTPHHFPSMLFTCAFTPDGRHLATADKVGHIVVWERETGAKAATLEAPVLYTWDPVQRRHSIGGIRALAFSPDGGLLAAGGIGKVANIDGLDGKARVEIFDWRKGERTHEFPGDKINGLVEHLAFHPGGDWLLAAGGANDGFVMAFDVRAKSVLIHEKAPAHVHDFVFDEAGDGFVAAAHGKIMAYEVKG
jgi:WD40 repeat protein